MNTTIEAMERHLDNYPSDVFSRRELADLLLDEGEEDLARVHKWFADNFKWPYKNKIEGTPYFVNIEGCVFSNSTSFPEYIFNKLTKGDVIIGQRMYLTKEEMYEDLKQAFKLAEQEGWF